MNSSPTPIQTPEPSRPAVAGQQNRRRAQRQRVGPGWTATVFAEHDAELDAVVENISPDGATLRLGAAAASLPQADGGELIVTIQAPTRHFTRLARSCWRRTAGSEILWGLAFVDHVGLTPETHQLDILEARIDPGCALKIPPGLALRRKLLPFSEEDEVVNLACADPYDQQGLQLAERLLKKPVRAWGVPEEALAAALQRVYGDGREAAPAAARGTPGECQGALALSEELLYAAYLRQASDVHIDPTPTDVHVRMRVDGRLETYARLPASVYQELISRLKVMSGMDIAEKRAPQDGRFSHQFANGGRRVDVRAATLPTKYGERMTLRLLAVQAGSLTLDRLGLQPAQRASLETFLRRSQGMMILTGPTGSGKTTTLYAAIRMLLTERDMNIVTVEDPIEYEIPGAAQCEVDAADKVSFAKALRSILRHDPDVVMIGEIRDRETADVAIKAALTGHLVLGTLHTNSSAATVTRLLDMGVEPYLVAATLRLVVAQRLVRRLCCHCRLPRRLTVREAVVLGRPELGGATVYEPSGCLYCNGRGYAGRVGLYELLSVRADWARAIAEGCGETALLEFMRGEGVQFLVDDAVDKLLNGVTPVSEVMAVALSW